MPKDRDEDLPRTLQRSPDKAKRTYRKTLESAHETYDDEERAHRTAYASLKHSFEKVGDHWEPKDKKGPSDERAADPKARDPDATTETAGGVDVKGNSKRELLRRARELGVRGRSKMSKQELGQAIARKQG